MPIIMYLLRMANTSSNITECFNEFPSFLFGKIIDSSPCLTFETSKHILLSYFTTVTPVLFARGCICQSKTAQL